MTRRWSWSRGCRPLGLGLAALALVTLGGWAYMRLARHEERALLARFGDAEPEYRRRVSMLVPRDLWRARSRRSPRETDDLA